jgi:hypothetical protein
MAKRHTLQDLLFLVENPSAVILWLRANPFHFRAAPWAGRLIMFGPTTHAIIAK